MTDKMTDNEIITALEHCSASTDCDSCNFGISENCVGDLLKTSLDLVIRLKEANKHHEKAEEFAEKAFKLHEEETKLKEKEIEILIRKKEALRDEIAEQQAEIESLKADKIIAERHEKDARELYKDVVIQLKTAKSEAYREFALDLKCGVPQETGVIRCANVDDTLKKLLSNDMGRYDHYTDSFVKETVESNE